ncbi:ABC transporter permease subunit [soil metagenome]
MNDLSRAIPIDLHATARPARLRPWRQGLVAAFVWTVAAIITAFWPDHAPFARTLVFGQGLLAIGVALGAAALLLGEAQCPPRLRDLGRWLIALPAIIAAWEILTAKTGQLPLPFFPPPQAILEVYLDDYARLAQSAAHSLILLLPGYAIGGLAGFGIGVSIGWSRAISYWVHPALRFVGPLPATAWLPLAFFAFPGSMSAVTFLIALSTGFPVAVLTASGIGSVNSHYYDIARTLGASQRFLITSVAIPAALPHVFVGLFMGLGASFAVLIVAEMMGVKAGLGWYLQWAQGWAAYANFYAALIVMSLLFSGAIRLLFLVRDKALAWQKGIVRW